MHVGQVIGRRFELEERVETGGMGQIFRAKDLSSGNIVALKLMLEDEPTHSRRFVRESMLLSELRHPRIVKYVADGVADTGQLYLVMEWLEGEDLSKRLKRGPLEMHQALILIEHVADALALAHAREIIHRDLKPGNLFLVGGEIDKVKVIDFGIAAISGATRLTHSGAMVGTPSYMAPEQIQNTTGEELDARADVFALGCILMECLTGARVFVGHHPFAVMAKILMEEPPRLREVRPGIPRELDAFVQLMLSKDRNARPRDGSAVATALRNIRQYHAPVEMTLTVPPPAGLTSDEQRIVSLILIGRERPVEDGPTLARSTWENEKAELDRVAQKNGCILRFLPDGSALVTIGDKREHSDPTTQLAYCALALKAMAPDRPLALTTGRGEIKRRLPVGAAIERAAKMVVECNTSEFLGHVLMDETSAHLLDGRFDVRRVGTVYTLNGVRHAGLRTLLGKPTAFIGRDAELQTLEDHFQQCTDDQVATAILVMAEAGMGKSRLLYEFLHSIRRTSADFDVWTGRGDLLAAGSALALLAHMLRGVFDLQEGVPIEVQQRKIRERVARHVPSTDVGRISEFLGELVGVPFPDAVSPHLQAARRDARLMSEQLRRAFEEFLHAETTHHPVVLVLEDLQWGDLPTVRFVDGALRNLTDQPLLVLALARPEVEEFFPHLWSERSVNVVRLQPLSRKASEKLVVQALGDRANSTLLARLVARAEGNAFYLEELVRTIGERTTIGNESDELPDTVLAVVQSRLEGLSPETRRCLRAASVFGEVFFRGGLAELLGMNTEAQALQTLLEELVEHELIQRQRQSRFLGQEQFVFRHALIRESAYVALTENDCQLGHRLAGQWLEQHGESDAMVLAHHFERSDEPSLAIGAYRRAAEHALGADDLDAAIARAERGVIRGASGEELAALRLIQAEAHNWRGELVLAEQRAMEAIGLVREGTTAWFRALHQIVDAAGKLGAFERIEHWGNPAGRVEFEAEAASFRTTSLSVCANHLVYGGRYALADAVIAALTDGVNLVAQPPRALGMYYQLRAIRASAAGDPCGFRDNLEEALVCFEQAGDRRNSCVTRQNLGFGLSELGDYEGAEQRLRSALAIGERMGLQEVVAYTLQNLGHVLGYRGVFEEGRSIQKRAIDAFRKQEQPRGMGLSQVYLAELELSAGDLTAAELEARAAIESLAGVPPLRAGALAVHARVLLARGNAAEALGVAREAYALLESLGTIEEGEALVRLVYAEALEANGDAEGFARVIATARDQVLAKAERIGRAEERERFLQDIADNARTLELARAVA